VGKLICYAESEISIKYNQVQTKELENIVFCPPDRLNSLKYEYEKKDKKDKLNEFPSGVYDYLISVINETQKYENNKSENA